MRSVGRTEKRLWAALVPAQRRRPPVAPRVMDYRGQLMSRVVPGQFDDADASDRWAAVQGPDSSGVLLSSLAAVL